MQQNLKTCKACGQEKELGLFRRAHNSRDGVIATCRVCQDLDTFNRREARRAMGDQIRHRWACRICLVIKSPEEFPPFKRSRSGKLAECRACKNRIASASHRRRYLVDPERFRAANRKWMSENRELMNTYGANRRAAKLQRMPLWLSREDRKIIKFIYEMARTLTEVTGIPHHVDHELPLRGKLVSGLHVPSNLQILTASENIRKKNKWSPEC